MGAERESFAFGLVRDRSKGLEVGRRSHFDVVNAFARQPNHCRTGFRRVCDADSDSIDRFYRALPLHAIDVAFRFEDLTGSLDVRANLLSALDRRPPPLNVSKVTAHIAHTSDAVCDEEG